MKADVRINGANDLRTDLEAYLAQVEASKAWFQHRVLPLSIEQLRWRPELQHWSVAECLDHLNLTLELYLPKIDDAIGRGQRGEKAGLWLPGSRAEIDALLRFEPPVAVAGPAPEATLPGAAVDPDRLVEAFHRTRDRYAAAIHRAAGLDLLGVLIPEPVYPAIVSLGGALALMAAHDRRHMWQAERVMHAARFPQPAF